MIWNLWIVKKNLKWVQILKNEVLKLMSIEGVLDGLVAIHRG